MLLLRLFWITGVIITGGTIQVRDIEYGLFNSGRDLGQVQSIHRKCRTLQQLLNPTADTERLPTMTSVTCVPYLSMVGITGGMWSQVGTNNGVSTVESPL